MEFQLANNQILLFENKKKQDRQPDYRGNALIDGLEIEIALWFKEGKNGKFLSGQIKQVIRKKNEENKNISEENQEESIPF